jgi:putative transposase
VNHVSLLLVGIAGWMNRHPQLVIEYLQEEILVLKEQSGKWPRFNDPQRRRLAVKGKSIGRKGLLRFARIVNPDTLLAWPRRLIARKYDSGSKRNPGRRLTAGDIRERVLKMARENRSWGYTRLQGALANLRHEIGRGTIANSLRDAGRDPSPERRKGTTWKEFLKMHRGTMAATDFFTVEVWTGLGLVRYHVLFVIGLMTREMHLAGIVPEPGENWMLQMARNLAGASEGFLRGTTFLIQDRSTLFTERFRTILKSAGIETLRLPARSPNLNAFAERFVRSIQESCLDEVILMGESSLRRAVSQFESHDHTERNHPGLENKIIQPEFAGFPTHGRIHCRERLGGMLRYYHREAA